MGVTHAFYNVSFPDIWLLSRSNSSVVKTFIHCYFKRSISDPFLGKHYTGAFKHLKPLIVGFRCSEVSSLPSPCSDFCFLQVFRNVDDTDFTSKKKKKNSFEHLTSCSAAAWMAMMLHWLEIQNCEQLNMLLEGTVDVFSSPAPFSYCTVLSWNKLWR